MQQPYGDWAPDDDSARYAYCPRAPEAMKGSGLHHHIGAYHHPELPEADPMLLQWPVGVADEEEVAPYGVGAE